MSLVLKRTTIEHNLCGMNRYSVSKWYLSLLFCLITLVSQANPLPAEEVFRFETSRVDPNRLSLNWQIKPGYFLYQEKIKIHENPDSNVQMGPITFPKAELKTDSRGHTVPVYRHQLMLPIAILGIQPGETLVDVKYQGCADDGFCYPPEIKQIKLTVDKNLALIQASLEKPNLILSPSETRSTPTLEKLFINAHWGIIILSFFSLGLLLSFTPCILPMVPVLSGIIVGHGHNLSTRKAFFLSLSYVLSMSITYALGGAAIALLGSNLQVAMQSPWTISLFSLIFVLLALSMFGYYQLRLPVSWQAKLALANRHQATGHYLGAALMGCLSTLILSPCVTAPLIAMLSYVARTGNVLFGSLTLFFLSLGMGTPLLIIGTSAGKWLPKAGKWMNTVQSFFGVIMLAVALYLLSRILPNLLTMILWASLFIFTGIYCGALTKATAQVERFYQGLGLMLLVYGLLILIGASMGADDPLRPLAQFKVRAVKTTSTQTLVKSVAEARQALAQAQGKPVILDFYADWCSSCKEIESMMKNNVLIQQALQQFVVLKADITSNTTQEKALLQQFNVVAPPTFLFFNRQGMELKESRLVGRISAHDFLNLISTLSFRAATSEPRP